MQVLLQNSLSGEFLRADGKWSSNMLEALDFGTSVRALEVAAGDGHGPLRIVLHFDDANLDLYIPIPHERD
jgi:hypothetical protein